MEQPTTIMPMTKEEFYKVYWFSPLQMVTLVNPKYDFKFMVEGRNYFIKSGATEKLPGTVANVYLSQMTRIMAQDDDKMSLLSDFAFMALYYKKLIVDVESLVPVDNSQPAYLANIPDHLKDTSGPETPPWQLLPEQKTAQQPETSREVEPQTKEFELEGSKYKMVIDKNDKETYFKNGVRISTADYSKAASMV